MSTRKGFPKPFGDTEKRHETVVDASRDGLGVPARVVGETGCDHPSRQMDQLLPSRSMDHVTSFDI